MPIWLMVEPDSAQINGLRQADFPKFLLYYRAK